MRGECMILEASKSCDELGYSTALEWILGGLGSILLNVQLLSERCVYKIRNGDYSELKRISLDWGFSSALELYATVGSVEILLHWPPVFQVLPIWSRNL